MLAFENASVLHWWNGFRAAALLQPEIEAKLVDRLSGVAPYMSRSLFEDSRAVCGTRGLDGLVERQLHARRECAHLRVTGMGDRGAFVIRPGGRRCRRERSRSRRRLDSGASRPRRCRPRATSR